ncbi:MAG: YjjG family noncanonical pyrimidine nucleotidase [Eubacteriales bacterium]
MINEKKQYPYEILLLDLDNTLLNFTDSEAVALPKVFAQHGYELTEEVYEVYKKVNHGLWSDFENDLIEMEDISKNRFAKTMERFGVIIDGEAWDNQYRENICEAGCLMPGVKEVITELAKTHRLFVATNGFTKTQMNRLDKTGILHCFEAVFTSQEIRSQKPKAAFFQYIKEHIKGFQIEKALMIGDSLKNDIQGASEVGLDTCYIWAVNGDLSSPIKRTYEIEHLRELLEIVRG